jgi:2-haloacid dehalogenase
VQRWATFDCYGTLIDWNGGIRDELAHVFGAPAEEHDALARALPGWEPFPEVPAALEEARTNGWRLAILSNSDRDLIDASVARLGVPFDETIVASEIGSYKPAPRHWEEFFARTGGSREAHVHVAASLFHDVEPATMLDLRTIWINRLGEAAEPQPDVELKSLDGLADALDTLAS